uniref:Uncharacterized protein n=1 Tax=Arundo donax TaxID=35708 RepID=A0A0A8XW58_ARUDO
MKQNTVSRKKKGHMAKLISNHFPNNLPISIAYIVIMGLETPLHPQKKARYEI